LKLCQRSRQFAYKIRKSVCSLLARKSGTQSRFAPRQRSVIK
jgi:hypothetical protein